MYSYVKPLDGFSAGKSRSARCCQQHTQHFILAPRGLDIESRRFDQLVGESKICAKIVDPGARGVLGLSWRES